MATNAEVAAWLSANPQATTAEITAAANAAGVPLSQVAAVQQQTFDPFSSSLTPANLQAVQKLDTSNLPSTYGRLYDGTGGDTGADPTATGYFSTNEVVNGLPVTAYYDAQGNLTKYVGNATQNLSDTYRQSAEWDAQGNAKPVNWSADNGLFNSGITFGDATKAAILAMVGAGTLGAGAPTGGETEALSGIDLGGVGASPNTWLGNGVYGAVPAAISSVVPAGAEAALSPVVAANAGSSVVAPVTAGSSMLPSIGSLTASQIAQLAKAGISIAGLAGAGKAISNISGGSGGGGMLTQQDRSGVSSGTANYSPEYYQAIQAKYNQMMPTTQPPRDVTTDLKSWYETKYAPKVA